MLSLVHLLFLVILLDHDQSIDGELLGLGCRQPQLAQLRSSMTYSPPGAGLPVESARQFSARQAI